MSDDSMSNKHRTNRRKPTTQPKDRWGDHKVIMNLGTEANQLKKKKTNTNQKAWEKVVIAYAVDKYI